MCKDALNGAIDEFAGVGTGRGGGVDGAHLGLDAVAIIGGELRRGDAADSVGGRTGIEGVDGCGELVARGR